MAKNSTTASAAISTAQPSDKHDSKRFPLKLKVFMSSFKNEKTGVVTPYVAAELIEPFENYKEDFNNVRIAPRWSKTSSLFNFRMRIYLKTHDDLIVNGYCEPVGYPSKLPADKNKLVYYPGIFFKLPYSGEDIEFGFKKKSSKDKSGATIYEESADSYVFRDLVSELWGGAFEPAVSGAEDETETE